MDETTPGPRTRYMLLNVGPAHPAMHGIIRIITKLEGEEIVDCDVEIGYLHRAFEKMSETVDYNGVMPYTDRLNYVSPLINNMGYCMAVEKLLGISVPERCHYIRVIMSEISRITDHLTCIGASAMELGPSIAGAHLPRARELAVVHPVDLLGAVGPARAFGPALGDVREGADGLRTPERDVPHHVADRPALGVHARPLEPIHRHAVQLGLERGPSLGLVAQQLLTPSHRSPPPG